jgi:DNA-binding MurR/RpiR family transcriptional regulator
VLQAKNRGVPTFGITDQHTTPLGRPCDAYLVAPATSGSFLPKWAAAMALIDAIVEVCALTQSKKSLDRLHRNEIEFKSGQAGIKRRATAENGS